MQEINKSIEQFKLDIFNQVLQESNNKKELNKEFLYNYINSLKELNIISNEEFNTIINLLNDYINTLLLVFAKSKQIKWHKKTL
ncbi:MAG: hypothetical protein ACI4TZ_03250 [Christensenellales bacterium]